MRKQKKKKFYAVPCMLAILALAGLLTAAGMTLRRTLLRELPQYADAPDIAIPLMLLRDPGPLREARERAEWEARQAALAAAATPEPTPEATPEATDVNVVVLPEETCEPTPEPTPAPTPEPTPEPEPESSAPAPEIYKNPRREKHHPGQTAVFIAGADPYDEVGWRAIAPNAQDVSLEAFQNVFTDCSVLGIYSDTLTITNVSLEMNGWSFYCVFVNEGSRSDTEAAALFVALPGQAIEG